ncbi:outer membrane beta-barrel protein [Sphingobacterium sp. Mn56C]|uniref:outer membrane beta-barrel protein n=1 Tax=Sphingobacterium sp. Mn56C TaxID=3395261 RepID=UPI003BEDA3CB
MKNFVLSIFLIFLTFSGFAQHTFSGKVLDKADNKPLTNASVILLSQDSILQYFTRVDEDGKFTFKKINEQPYIFIVSYPKFELYTKPLTLTDADLTLEPIKLSSQANLIEEVVIQQKLPIRMNGDTIEYNAGSFETEKNAKLEDLLRRLPGLSVSADGQITAHGKSVSKVLIDGEEFFGYDPKIAIRNVRADAVDKVQVYERKSEEAELTGVDDGTRIQTINVVLKEEARKGVFGNTEALAGTSKLYTGNLFAAMFNKTERSGVTVNTNNMGSGNATGSLRMNSQIVGNPYSTQVGANYENQFLQKKMRLNTNYNFNTSGNNNESIGYRKQVLPDVGIQENHTDRKTENNRQNHGLRAEVRWRVDSTANFTLQFNADRGNSSSYSRTIDSLSNEKQGRVSRSINENSSDGTTNRSDLRLNYRKRLNKKGTSLNVLFTNRLNNGTTNSTVNETAVFYLKDSIGILNQERINVTKSNAVGGQIQLNQNLGKNLNFTLGYNVNYTKGSTELSSYNLKTGMQSRALDSLYSQDQHTDNSNNTLVSSMNFTAKKVIISLSNRVIYRSQALVDNIRSIDLNRTFWDNDFNMDMNFNISNRKGINLNYQNSFDIPTFAQLQRLQPLTNQLFIQEGNPNLKKTNKNNFRLNYNTMSLLKRSSWNINSEIGFVSNPIVNQMAIDSLSGVTTSSYVNVFGKSAWNASVNLNYGRPLFHNDVQFGGYMGTSYNNSFSYIRFANAAQNSQYTLNNTQTANVNVGVNLNEQNSKGLDYDISWNFSINNVRNSVNKDLNYTNLNTGGSAYLKYFLPKNFFVGSTINYALEGPTKFYTKSIQQFYTNLELSKKLLKSESLIASIKIYDVFKSYNNINRSTSADSFSQTQQQMLTRYVLLGLKWDFNKNLGKKNNE